MLSGMLSGMLRGCGVFEKAVTRIGVHVIGSGKEAKIKVP